MDCISKFLKGLISIEMLNCHFVFLYSLSNYLPFCSGTTKLTKQPIATLVEIFSLMKMAIHIERNTRYVNSFPIKLTNIKEIKQLIFFTSWYAAFHSLSPG